jgi:3-polyprenyl-4-hydroxybenzoate decarboxylase
MKRLEVIYIDLQSVALEHELEQQEMADALSIARSIDNRYQTDEIWKIKAQILIEPLQKYWPEDASKFLEFNQQFRDLPEEYKKKAEIARAEYRVDHLKHYIVTGRDIDWKQLKADSKLIKEVYDKK